VIGPRARPAWSEFRNPARQGSCSRPAQVPEPFGQDAGGDECEQCQYFGFAFACEHLFDHELFSVQRCSWFVAAALNDIEPRLRRLSGYRHLPALREAIMEELEIQPKERRYGIATYLPSLCSTIVISFPDKENMS